MLKRTYLIFLPALFISANLKAQVKIGDNPGTITSNSLLELESTTKGFLPPRVTLMSVSSVSPLTGTVAAGMLVYNSGSTLTEGYYYWTGSVWKKIEAGESSPVTKTSNTALTKNETLVFVYPSGTKAHITLPNISAADAGLRITIKNIGDPEDLVTIKDAGDDPIDGGDTVQLTRWVGQTFVAGNNGWLIKDRIDKDKNFLEVNAHSSWTDIPEVISYLEAHMHGPAVVRLGDAEYELSATVVVDLPYPLTFQGLSYGTTSIVPHGTNMPGKTMFRCISDCYFKMLNFTYNSVASYGDSPLEDAIHFLGAGTYNEIKDCTFDRFYNTIIDSTSAELWVFETDISNAGQNGILLHSGVAGAILKVAETDFINCDRGINMDKGSGVVIQLASGGYYNGSGTDTAIKYKSSTFLSFASITITGNSWNNTGIFITGFDFTRSDGRDKNAILESNAGMGDQKPGCVINVLNSVTTKTLTNKLIWYVADWGSNTSSETCKWTIASNKITYQPSNHKSGTFIISGNLSVNSSNQVISIGIVKNGSSGVRYGETTLRTQASNQPYQFTFIAYLADMSPGDYFEVWYYNATDNGRIVTIQDLQWLATTQ